ncbi:type IV secretion system protein [Pseudoblastomonas halimionae]|uniref:type IV secretion system protein n=1 Tax=Alteriqipengyuania halimionae TaxID=1926630 RepID=UPI002D7EF42E|nr:type IV secretion system protein [Alteriqipengyuania halimionae]
MAASRCDLYTDGVAGGLAATLRGVDCVAGEMAQAAFARLLGPDGQLMPALTIFFTLFIALFGLALMTGRTRVGIAQLTPRFATLFLVILLTSSWLAFSSIVWNLFVLSPDYLASVITGSDGSATATFAQKIDITFATIGQIAGQGGESQDISVFSPTGLLWLGGTLLLLGTVGVLVTAKIALAVLVALGPLFVPFVLFQGTRGLFVGWLKGLTMLALAPLFAVLAGGVMLELAVPVISSLATQQGNIDPRAAMAFFLIGAVHVALMVLVIKVSGTMVSGWTVFGLARDRSESRTIVTTTTTGSSTQPREPAAAQAAAASASAASRARMPAAILAANAANDGGGVSTRSEIRTVTERAAGVAAGTGTGGPSRTHGIGSRFRAPSTASKPEMIR